VVVDLEPIREGLSRAGADAIWVHPGEAAGHGEHFIHRTGHGVGLEIHEPPCLRPGDPEPLQAGHVFSVEPGIYVPGRFGVRFENLVHLGADGPELLNAAPREPTLAAGA
jgi:Xaa-Pro aminopeptidase